MSIDRTIELSAWVITGILLILFVPKNKFREANVIFFFKQLITWVLGLTTAEYGLIKYPVRLFAYATRANFTFEYFVYPSICVLFNLYYPNKKSVISQLLYYVLYCSGITLIEVLLKDYTNLIVYIRWTWYYTWISFFLTFFISRTYYIWFFKLNKDC
jgi:hypothetical protein